MMEQEQNNPEDEIQKVRTNHDEAYMYISQGLSYEEQGQTALAKEMYTKGIQKIQSALSVRCDRSYCVGERWDKVRKMQQKMRLTLQKVHSQLSDLERAPLNDTISAMPSVNTLDRPPSYEEACGGYSLPENNSFSSFNSNLPSYKPDVNGNTTEKYDLLRNEKQRGQSAQSMGAEEIFCISSDVQMFYISPEGYVSAPSYPSSLHIYKFVDSNMAAYRNSPQAWLQVDQWIYPLDPGKTPVLHSGFGAYVFPDVAANQTGASVGLILPAELDQSTRDLFESILVELTVLRKEKPVWSTSEETEIKDRVSYKISQGIVAGAELLSEGLTKGVELTSDLMKKGASKLRERVSPDERPMKVDPRVQQGITVARNISGTVLTVSGFLVSKLGKMTVALGKQLAPHVKKQGERAMSAVFQTDTVDSQKKMDDVMIVAAGGLKGFSTVYVSLENAARSLAYCLTNETVQTVNHKYGPEMSNVVDNAMNAVGNMAVTAHNVSALGVKAIAKRTAKDAGKAVLIDYVDRVDNNNEADYTEQQNSLQNNEKK